MTEQKITKTVLLGVDLGEYSMERSMEELEALAQAGHMEVVAVVTQKRDTPDAATFMGEGRLTQAKQLCADLCAECAVFDAELSGSQIRNLSDFLEVEVLDRTMLILEIFKSRAMTNEGKLQTELASLRYRLPRLSGLGASLSRQGGGGAGGAGARRGAGESKLEYDRRHIRRRIDALEQRLADVERRRAETRRHRQKTGIPVVALVGYTNVGKSSLLNRLCGADVLAADMLFATLDPTARRLRLPSGMEVVAIDTVGFVSRLPHGLVEAFKSTLEEAAYADVIVKVCDATAPDSAGQLAVTDSVLNELGCADIPQITVYNKYDLAPGVIPFETKAVCTSAATGQGLEALAARIDALLANRVRRVCVLLPYNKLGAAAPMRQRGTVLHEEYRPDGLYLDGIVKAVDLHLIASYLCPPQEP